MSEFTEKEKEKSCQKRLAPPRSIRDAGGKTQIVWDMIAKRYPRAAPLLSEMETAIDRAETLLQQLRRVPYDNDIVTKFRVSSTPSKKSHSTETSYSEECQRQRSETSIKELSSTSEDTNEEVQEVGTRISYVRIPEMEDPSSSASSSSIQQSDEKITSSLKPQVGAESKNSETAAPEHELQKLELARSSIPLSCHEKQDATTTKEVESLEGWEMVAGVEMTKMKKAHTKREASIGRYDAHRQTIKSAVLGSEKSTKSREEKVNVPTINKESSEPPESSKVKKNRKSPNRNPTTSPGSLASPMGTDKSKIKDKHKKVNPDEQHSPKNITERKTAEEILEDYAVKNKKEAIFKVLDEHTNFWKMECSFAGFTAQHFGASKSTVRNELAIMILRMVAERQMDEHDMGSLGALSDNQMRDIIALGSDGKPENSMRKLYKLCLEKNVPKPIYTVKCSNGVEGVKNFAECRALGKVGHGSQIREEKAKIQAAEELYEQLYLDQSP